MNLQPLKALQIKEESLLQFLSQTLFTQYIQRQTDQYMTQMLERFSPQHLGFLCCPVGDQPSQQASLSRKTCGFLLNRLLLYYTPQPAIHLPVRCNDDHGA